MTWNNQITANFFLHSDSVSVSLDTISNHCESDGEMKQWRIILLLTKCSRSRFYSVQWSWIAKFSHHSVAYMQLSYAPTKEWTSDAALFLSLPKATEVGYSHFVQCFFFCCCLWIPLSVANIFLFSFYLIFGLCVFCFNEEHWLWFFMHINKVHAYNKFKCKPFQSQCNRLCVTRRESKPRNKLNTITTTATMATMAMCVWMYVIVEVENQCHYC